jgi:sugar phosphate isomerase/epimerase
MPEVSISTWSLHRALGKVWYDRTNKGFVNRALKKGRIQLLDVPGEVAAHGIRHLEICHFHFPKTDADFIEELKSELARHNVSLFSILIDAWDITHPDPAQREEELVRIREWIDVAAACGAANVRVVAGQAEACAEAVVLSSQNLLQLAHYAEEREVRVMTENFKRLTQRAAPLIDILNRCEGKVGLCTDLGNFKGEHKLDDLALVLPYADTIHTKADYEDGVMMRDRFLDCMELSKKANFSGYYTLIFQDPGEEWSYLNALKREILPYL